MDVYARVRNLPGFTELQATYPAAFLNSLVFVLAHENEYDAHGNVVAENVEGDRGGVTKYGVDQRSHEAEDIRNLTLSRAVEIYAAEYWTKGRCDEMPRVVALFHFDTCVNMGVGAAAKILQSGLQVVPDGIIGPKTLAAVRYTSIQSLIRMIDLRKQRYIRLSANEGQSRFLRGWLNRMIDLSQYLLK